jgi:hypothetical protein
MAEAKKRPWIMQTLLQRGPDAEGISAEQFEAGIEVADAYDALTRGAGFSAVSFNASALGYSGSHDVDLSPREVRLTAIYLAWVMALQQRSGLHGSLIVEWIKEERPLGHSLPWLVKALELWIQQRDDWRPALLTQPVRPVLTSGARVCPNAPAPPSILRRSV